MKYRPDIDGLRALAVVPVVLNHAGIPGFSGGYVGVDVFFVISGYLITSILAGEINDGSFSLAGFYERRVRRILPALFVVLAVCLGVGYFRLIPDHYDSLSQGVLATLLFVSNVWFWAEAVDYFTPGVVFNPLLHTWSLSVEEQFYVVFPVLLWVLMTRIRGWTVLVISALVVFSFALSWWVTEARPEATFFLSHYRVWELGLGALLALAPLPRAQGMAARVTGLVGLGAIGFAIVAYDETTLFPGAAAAVPCLGATALIWAGGAAAPGPASRLLSLAPVVAVGLISYSLYLWHWPVMAYARIQQSSTELDGVTAAICIGVSLLLATVSWRFVERPFRRRGANGSRRSVFRGAGGVAALLFVAALAVDQTDGVETRLSDELLVLRQADMIWDVPTACRNADFRKPACVSGEGPIDVLVWGDSHAGTLWTTVAAMAHEGGMVAATVNPQGCAPLIGVMRVGERRGGQACARRNMRVLDDILSSDDVDTVILFARWPVWAERRPPEGEAGRPFLLADTETGTGGAGDAAQLALFATGLDRTVGALRASGREVVILGGAPEIGWLVREARLYAAFVGRDLPPAPDLDDIARRQGRAHTILEDMATRHGAVHLPIARTACTPVCPVAADGGGLYSDSNHLNRRGVEHLVAPLLAPYLQQN